MLKLYSKFQGSMFKSLEVIIPFTSRFSPVLVQCYSSLFQAVTSQAENFKQLKEVLIELMSKWMCSGCARNFLNVKITLL